MCRIELRQEFPNMGMYGVWHKKTKRFDLDTPFIRVFEWETETSLKCQRKMYPSTFLFSLSICKIVVFHLMAWPIYTIEMETESIIAKIHLKYYHAFANHYTALRNQNSKSATIMCVASILLHLQLSFKNLRWWVSVCLQRTIFFHHLNWGFSFKKKGGLRENCRWDAEQKAVFFFKNGREKQLF